MRADVVQPGHDWSEAIYMQYAIEDG
uniref:Uncharacterized protein n=1 Tax=Vitis vinifera TaxID=29760 RepID=F6HVB8_VITVI